MSICVFYHCILSGGSVPINTEAACEIFHEQMRALKSSGLLAEADEFHIGINGPADDVQIAKLFVTRPSAKFIIHGAGATSEIPTMEHLRRWLPGHEGWKVLYLHSKGVTHPNDPFYDRWRQRMTLA